MNVASLELCKELFELSGWKTGRHVWSMKNPKLCRGDDFMDGMSFAAYDLGYLLRKLPDDKSVEFRADHWIAGWYHQTLAHDVYGDEADTPEDAAAKLAIQLFNQGVLTKAGDAKD